MEIFKIVTEYFDIGEVHTSYPGGGSANRNVILETSQGKFMLRIRVPRSSVPNNIRFEHEMIEELSKHGFPVVLRLYPKTGGEDRFILIGDRAWEISPYIEGFTYQEKPIEVQNAARTLGKFHRTLRNFKPRHFKIVNYETPENLELYAEIAISFLQKSSGDALIKYIRKQVDLCCSRLRSLYANLDLLIIPVHADYTPANLLFNEHGEVSGIFDFDRSGIYEKIYDVAGGTCFFAGERKTPVKTDIFSLTQPFILNIEKLGLFLQAYQEEEHLSEDEILNLPIFILRRWLRMKLEPFKQDKIPLERSLEFLDGLHIPIDWLEEHKEEICEIR